MTGTEMLALLAFMAFIALGFTLATIRVKKRGAAVRIPMQAIAASAGWQDVRPRRVAGIGIEGTWNGYRVRIGFRERYKGIPPQLYVKAETQSESVLTVKKPSRTFFGPERIEMAAAPDLMVRGDSRMLADRVFASRGIVERIRRNLLSNADELRIDHHFTRIHRLLRDDAVKGRIRGDRSAEFDRIVNDEWELIERLLSEVTLRA